MTGLFGLPSGLAQETHPYALQPGAKLVEGFEIPEYRFQTAPCEGGIRIISLDDSSRPHLAVDKDMTGNILQGPICIPSHIGGKPVVEIGSVAFSELPEITKVIIPAGVRLIRQRAFSDCQKLKSATIYLSGPDSVQVIGHAFPPGCVVTYVQRPEDIRHGVRQSVNEIV